MRPKLPLRGGRLRSMVRHDGVRRSREAGPASEDLIDAVLEEGWREEVRAPLVWDCLLGEGVAVVDVVGCNVAALLLAVVEGAEMLPRAALALEVAADHRPEVLRVVELLLGAVRIWASQAQGAALRVGGPSVLLAPEGARLRPVADGRLPPRVLVGVRVDARLPVVLRADRAPQRLELPREEGLGQGRGRVLLLLLREEWCHHLLARVCEGAAGPAAAGGHVGEGGAEALLLVA
mmetsp:Transcript_33759/g.100257  ORF Transcript_33759/g.100257 Transcript_33759/m.100257 type:complete len:235 (-) Transcript_33759:705-1409(-)